MKFLKKKRFWITFIIVVIVAIILGQVFKKSNQAYVTAKAVKDDLVQTVELRKKWI